MILGCSNRYWILISQASCAYIFSLIIYNFCITLRATKKPVCLCLAKNTSLYFPDPNFFIIRNPLNLSSIGFEGGVVWWRGVLTYFWELVHTLFRSSLNPNGIRGRGWVNSGTCDSIFLGVWYSCLVFNYCCMIMDLVETIKGDGTWFFFSNSVEIFDKFLG